MIAEKKLTHDETNQIIASIPELEKATRLQIAPSADNAIVLLYIKEVVFAKATSFTSASEFAKWWNEVLDDNDILTLKVLVDFACKIQGTDNNGKKVIFWQDRTIQEMVEKSRVALMTPEQREMQRKLDFAKGVRKSVQGRVMNKWIK